MDTGVIHVVRQSRKELQPEVTIPIDLCVGKPRAKIARLPDTRGMPNEIVIQRAHRFAYDQAYRVAGAVLVEIGLARRTSPHELARIAAGKVPAAPLLSR